MESEDRLVPIEDDEELGRVMAALEATESYGEVILDEGQEDRDEMGVLDELGEEYEGNGDRGEDDNEEAD
jgi:C1A family cysteine protease